MLFGFMILVVFLSNIIGKFSYFIFAAFAVIRGWLVRRCSGDIGLLKSGGTKVISFLISETKFQKNCSHGLLVKFYSL